MPAPFNLRTLSPPSSPAPAIPPRRRPAARGRPQARSFSAVEAGRGRGCRGSASSGHVGSELGEGILPGRGRSRGPLQLLPAGAGPCRRAWSACRARLGLGAAAGRRRRRRAVGHRIGRSRGSATGSPASRPASRPTLPWPFRAMVEVASRSMKSRSWLTRIRVPSIVGQQVLEQVQRLHVEVVGRLVEHQQVGRLWPGRGPAAGGCARRPTGLRTGWRSWLSVNRKSLA